MQNHSPRRCPLSTCTARKAKIHKNNVSKTSLDYRPQEKAFRAGLLDAVDIVVSASAFFSIDPPSPQAARYSVGSARPSLTPVSTSAVPANTRSLSPQPTQRSSSSLLNRLVECLLSPWRNNDARCNDPLAH